jgi:Spy/CpxP family protein refolding chaperone
MSPGPLGPGPQGFERLGLTDAQREKLASLRDEELRKAIRTEADLRIAELDLRKLAEDEHPNLQAIGAQVDRLLALRANWMKSRIAGMIAARAVLTPAQRAKLHAPPGGPWGRGGEAPEPPEQP